MFSPPLLEGFIFLKFSVLVYGSTKQNNISMHLSFYHQLDITFFHRRKLRAIALISYLHSSLDKSQAGVRKFIYTCWKGLISLWNDERERMPRRWEGQGGPGVRGLEAFRANGVEHLRILIPESELVP